MTGDELDPEIAELVGAINAIPGLTTFESCCGHDEKPVRVWFSAKGVDDVALLSWCSDACHIDGLRASWTIFASTDCLGETTRFLLESRYPGADSYVEGRSIAEAILRRLWKKFPGDGKTLETCKNKFANDAFWADVIKTKKLGP